MTFFHMGFAAQNPTWGFYAGINYCEFLLRTVTRPIFHMGFPTFSSERHRLTFGVRLVGEDVVLSGLPNPNSYVLDLEISQGV